jgi:hypothetical protein
MITNDDNIIIEFVSCGNFVKVTAVDTNNGDEACIIGDSRQDRKTLTRLAIKKLLNKQSKND